MKFMKLGSKPDSFQTDGDNIRYVATDLASDVTVNVGDVKFYLHKFPLLSKSARLQKLLTDNDEIDIHDIPGGTIAFEICAKFCYGMTVTLNAYNVVAARCAAEYLEMYETIDKGNLIYKLEVFLNSSIFRSWKDSIIVLQTTKSLLPWCEELKVVNHCLESIATKASIDTSKVEWSYTYNRQKLASENEIDPLWKNIGRKQQQTVPNDWWVEDLCDLQLDLYKRVITTIKTKGTVTNDVIGEALRAYSIRRLPNFNNGMIQCDVPKIQALVETITWLLPVEKGTVHCRFLLVLLKATLLLECGETVKRELVKRIGQQLEEAMVADLLIQSKNKETMSHDVDIVRSLVSEFCMSDRTDSCTDNEIKESRSPKHISDTSKMKVAGLVDGYLAEVARDPKLLLSVFVELAEMVSSFSRLTHDGLYRAIDMFLKEHPGISKSEKKKICSLMDCKKLSPEACTHAVQNERLPLRVVVQVLFFEQVRAATSSSSAGSSTPDVPDSIKAASKLPGGSLGSSRSTTTTTEEDWDANIIDTNENTKENVEKVLAGKMKSMLMSKKIFSKIWSGKDKSHENSSSDTSESATADELKSTPSRSRRQSLS